MNIVVIGTGHIGLVTGTCFSERGNHVTCVDIDKNKIKKLNNGIIPVYEPDLEELVRKNQKEKRLFFAFDLTNCLKEAEVIFITVDAPLNDDNIDLYHVLEASHAIGENMDHYVLVAIKSTVPVGTSQRIKVAIQKELDRRKVSVSFDLASNPEFLKEGTAIENFMNPDRVIVGLESEKARKLIDKLYKPHRIIYTDILSAEMIKYAANAMLATRISFMNDMANLCDLIGADINMVRRGIGCDSRIGNQYLNAGCGYGGSCLSKDVKTLIQTGLKNGYTMQILQAVEAVNSRQKTILFDKLLCIFENDLKGKVISFWGLAFKPDTDDVREAPAFVMIDLLLDSGAILQVYDPVAMKEAKKQFGDRLFYCKNMYDAAQNANALLLLTEWKEFRLPNWKLLKKTMHQPIILDGRNIYNKKKIQSIGFTYIHI